MTRMTLFLGTAALVLTLTTAAQAQDTTIKAPTTDAPATDAAPTPTADPATVVATVDGTDITLGQLIIARSQLPQQYDQFPPRCDLSGCAGPDRAAATAVQQPERCARPRGLGLG